MDNLSNDLQNLNPILLGAYRYCERALAVQAGAAFVASQGGRFAADGAAMRERRTIGPAQVSVRVDYSKSIAGHKASQVTKHRGS